MNCENGKRRLFVGTSRRSATALILAIVVTSVILATRSANAQTFNVLFEGNSHTGSPFRSRLIEGPDGTLFGTTSSGGTGTFCFQGAKYGCGTVFKITPQGKYRVLYSFGASLQDGESPAAGVVRDNAGNLYGTTSQGGAYKSGTVFKLDAAGNETILYNFTGLADGSQPFGFLVLDKAGNLYGTTPYGGANGKGTVFKVDTSNNETVLYNFTGGSDGANPFGGLLLDASGNLSGTASTGGFGNVGCGVIFKLDSNNVFTTRHEFGSEDGCQPQSDVVQDVHGVLYGTTVAGGLYNEGVIYRLDLAGNLTVRYAFSGQSDGLQPLAGVVRDPQGNIYGTTTGGLWGTVYKLDPLGTLTTLHTFAQTDGAAPRGDLVLTRSGTIYGTTQDGGDLNGCHNTGCGVIFSIVP